MHFIFLLRENCMYHTSWWRSLKLKFVVYAFFYNTRTYAMLKYEQVTNDMTGSFDHVFFFLFDTFP